MKEWRLKDTDLKRYPHFDPVISSEDAEALALDPEKVAQHAFYPFLLYNKHWNRFSKRGESGKSKDRPIRYAARRDSYIFSRYRHILAEKYEEKLSDLGLGDCVLAYRRILKKDGNGGKCNIDFSLEAFLKIRQLGNCHVIAIDISSYFENIDHEKLKNLWIRLLDTKKLPPDHFQVFKAITRHAVVDKEKVYERLGHYGVKRASKSGKPINGYLTEFHKIPKQLCNGNDFREKIAGGIKESIIKVNTNNYGIPQGAPISDLLANIYLLEFDRDVRTRVESIGGAYYRYSDDILIIVPGDDGTGLQWLSDMQALIREHGEKLEIKASKSAVWRYFGSGQDQTFIRDHGEKGQGRNGLEYLGFRYDGHQVYIRDSTLAGLRRKVTFTARRDANILANKNPEKNIAEIMNIFNYERLTKRFGKVELFMERQKDFKSWTFWTYAKRASDTFGDLGHPILRQLRRHTKLVRGRCNNEIVRAVTRRDNKKSAEV